MATPADAERIAPAKKQSPGTAERKPPRVGGSAPVSSVGSTSTDTSSAAVSPRSLAGTLMDRWRPVLGGGARSISGRR